MANVESFINDDELSDVDHLDKMALIHHQFESIHPFYDGNGRIGRIINILYLCLKGFLDLPILCLSRYIIDRKEQYYTLLQEVRETNDWQEWIIYILDGIIFMGNETITLIRELVQLMQTFKQRIRLNHPKMYSQDLVNCLFSYPYTKIDFIRDELKVSRQTASKYLKTLSEENLLKEERIGRSNYYVNEKLIHTAIHVRKKSFEKL